MGRERGLLVAAIAVTALAPGRASAQTASQTVHFQVNAVNQIAVSGNPTPLAITTATAGGALTSVTSTGTSYAITTNEANQKISASLDQALPAGVTLEVALAAPPGASSAGSVQLGTAGADVVTGISTTAAGALPITYRLNATPQVQLNATARTVTFTIVSGT